MVIAILFNSGLEVLDSIIKETEMREIKVKKKRSHKNKLHYKAKECTS